MRQSHHDKNLKEFCGIIQEEQSDSQLINSVYLDNSSMELYHGRLDKRPNAIAIRIRYMPSTCLHSDLFHSFAI